MDLGLVLKRDVLAPIGYRIYGMNTTKQREYTDFLLRFEHMTRAEVEKHQVRKLRDLLTHCEKRIPYYHRLFKELHFDPNAIQTMKDLTQLPLMTKSVFTANFEALKEPDCRTLELCATGGTSGQPFRFYIDRRMQDICYANAQRFFTYAGFVQGIRQAYFWGNAEDFKRSKKIKGRIKNFVDNKFYFNSYNINNSAMATYYARLKDWREYAVTGFPSSIYFFSKYLRDNNLEIHPPSAILTTGERLYDYQRILIENTLKNQVFSFYGSQEFGVLGCECTEHDGFHLDEANAVFEIEESLNDHPGNGRLVVTSLINYGMPFVRYVLGDVGQLSLQQCSCGRTSVKLVNMQGRITDFIVDVNGNLINFGLFSDVLEFAEGISQYKAYQNQKGAVEITLLKNNKYNESEFERIKQRISNLLGERLIVTYIFTDNIPTLSSGKFQPVKSDVAADYL